MEQREIGPTDWATPSTRQTPPANLNIIDRCFVCVSFMLSFIFDPGTQLFWRSRRCHLLNYYITTIALIFIESVKLQICRELMRKSEREWERKEVNMIAICNRNHTEKKLFFSLSLPIPFDIDHYEQHVELNSLVVSENDKPKPSRLTNWLNNFDWLTHC